MGNPVSRRRALAGFGSTSLGAVVAACSDDDSTERRQGDRATRSDFDRAARCTRTAEQTEGPFYFEVDRVRSDVREDRDGVPLHLGIRVRDDSDGCRSIKDAVLDIWHCDAEGSYAEPGETVDSLLSRMTDRRIRHLPVCKNERLMGIVSIGDLVKWKISEVEAEADGLKAYIAAS